MSEPKVHAIVAMTERRVIGNGRNLPWKGLKQDMAHFKEMTMGHPVIMGRKTWDSIPERYRPLEGRTNFVLSRKKRFILPPGVFLMDNIEDALDLATKFDNEKVFIIGGAEIYKAALPYTHVINATVIMKGFTGDTLFPPIPENFKETPRSKTFEENGIQFYYIDYEAI
ncbi:MAG: dihydrofolate reductase [Candidatus Paceibacteria bacterium]|jgi:dihydrofolate reductase